MCKALLHKPIKFLDFPLFLKSEQEKILLGRYGNPEEVAHLVKFLVSDEASYINNSVIRIDGGQYGA